jgi:hypothetical protein
VNNVIADPAGGVQGGAGAARGWRGAVPRWIVAAVFAGLAWRQLRFVGAHSVNILYWDQWDFYRPLFQGQGWWETFAYQHGPHREGVGLVLMRILADLSGWDSRWDAFAQSLILIGAAALGLRLATRFGIPGSSLALAAVPLLFLNVLQYEIFVGAVNLSYSAMPMFLLMGYCLCWFARDARWRILAISALTFLLLFTGFGLFVGILTPLLLATECVQALRAREKGPAALSGLGLAASGASWALFSHGYLFQPAVPGFRFPYERPAQYFVFVGRMLGNFFGAPILSLSGVILGLLVAAALVLICIWHGRRVVRIGVAREPASVVLFCLSAFTLLFCTNAAIGRVFTGEIAPLSSRYVTLLIPGAMALFLQIALLGRRMALGWPAIAYAALLVPGTCFLRPLDVTGINWYTEGRTKWKAAYLETHDEAKADRIAGFPIYPGPIGDRLRYLEERRLNLFSPPD